MPSLPSTPPKARPRLGRCAHHLPSSAAHLASMARFPRATSPTTRGSAGTRDRARSVRRRNTIVRALRSCARSSAVIVGKVELIASPGAGRFVERARFGEELLGDQAPGRASA